MTRRIIDKPSAKEQLRRSPTSLSRLRATLGALPFGLLLLWGEVALSQQISTQKNSIPPKPPSEPIAAPSSPLLDSATAPVPSRFRITGTVINSITKSPVPKAELAVSRMASRSANGRSTGRAPRQTAGQANTTLTDAAGHFEIEVPSAGGWSLVADAHGYHAQAFDQHEEYSSAIVLTEKEPSFDIVFPLTPAAAIEGYVLDEAGEAVRNAQLVASLVTPATPDDAHPRLQSRGSQRTDDRGYYKFSGLLAGNYEIRLQAKPWYATTASRSERLSGIGAIAGSVGSDGLVDVEGSSSVASATPDPLDVVYATVWFPGVADFAAATPITLRSGEIREADFRLSPVPGFHLRIPAVAAPADETRRPIVQNGAYLSQVLPDGTETAAPTAVHIDALGNTDYLGLAPGTYVVHRQGESVSSSAAALTIQISPNSSRTVDLSQASTATEVTVKIDPAADLPSLQISFREVESGRVSYVQDPQSFGARGAHRGSPIADGLSTTARRETSQQHDPEHTAARSINLQPGRYEVTLSGINDLHLASIEATGATAIGRTVTIGSGSPMLMLHVASGRTNVTGFVRSHGSADSGAMVLLVPATLGDPANMDITRRDQTNTDGSFDILNVLLGAYILVAIDHGWDVNWHDPATLRRFLLRGVPLDLNAPGDRKETIEAQSP